MRHFAVLTLLASAFVLGACEGTDFRIDPVLVTDTVEIAVPTPANAALPSALDIVSSDRQTIGGGRFPELASDAGEWDFALRERDGGLALVPAAVLGLESRAALTAPLLDETFDGLIEAPGRTTFSSERAVVLEEGRVYVAFSRLARTLISSSCEQYAKLQPLDVDPVLGRVTLRITTSAICGDPRLAPED